MGVSFPPFGIKNFGTRRSLSRSKHKRYFGEKDWVEVAWSYQLCTEVYQPMPTDGVSDIELPYQPNKEEYFKGCQQRWGTTPRPDWEEMNFMSDNIQGGSNIFLTTGELDPWRAGGIQKLPRNAHPDKI